MGMMVELGFKLLSHRFTALDDLSGKHELLY